MKHSQHARPCGKHRARFPFRNLSPGHRIKFCQYPSWGESIGWLRSLPDAPDLKSGEGRIKATVGLKTCAQPVPPPEFAWLCTEWAAEGPREAHIQRNFLRWWNVYPGCVASANILTNMNLNSSAWLMATGLERTDPAGRRRILMIFSKYPTVAHGRRANFLNSCLHIFLCWANSSD